MAEPYDFVAAGDVMLDVHVAVPLADRVTHGAVRVVAGGSAVNAARAAVALGASAAVVGRVGDDPAGAAIAAALAHEGIASLLDVATRAVTGAVVYSGSGVVAERGANAGFVPRTLPPARVTLVSGYLDPEAVEAALSLASGVRAVDLQRPGTHPFDADVVLGNDLELAALAPLHDVVCSTLGARGAIAYRKGLRVEAAPTERRSASPRGSGDAFAAGFLLALADGLPLEECLQRGNASALALV